MPKCFSSILLLLMTLPLLADVKVSNVVTRENRLTSSLITCGYTVETPLGYSVEFPRTVELKGVNFISRTLFPVEQGQAGQLVSKASYAFTIPMAGIYLLDLPDLAVNTGGKYFAKSIPSCKVEVLSRLPSDGLVSIPFIGRIEVNPQYNSQVIWVVMVSMAVIALVAYFLIKRRLKKNQPSNLSKLWLLKEHNELTPALLRTSLLESVGLEGGSYSNSELNAMISGKNESGFDCDSLILLLNQLNESSFSRDGLLSDALIADAFSFIEQNQIEEV